MSYDREWLAVLGFVACLLASNTMRAELNLEERRLVAEVAAQAGDYEQELADSIRIDSRTENLPGVREAGAYFGKLLAEIGFSVRWAALPAESKRAGHLIAERRGNRGKRLLLVGHLDTVLAGGSYRNAGGRGFGSGVNDMKGGNLVMVHALRALCRTGLLEDAQVLVCLTGDEESPGADISVVRKDLFDCAKRSDLALVFEGTEGNFVTTARRGVSFWELEVQAASGHSAGILTELSGYGAVFEAARILDEFRGGLRSEERLTFNPGVIVGGFDAALEEAGGSAKGKPNVIASRVLAKGDLRYLDAAQLRRVKRSMHEIAARNLPRTSASLRFDDRYPAMEVTTESRSLFDALDGASRDMGYGELRPCDPRFRGAGDASFIAPIIPTIDGLGVRGEGAHTEAEDIDLASVTELVGRTAVLVYRLTR